MNFHLSGIFGWLLKPLMALCMLGFAAGNTALGGDGGGSVEIAGGEGDGDGGDFEGDGGGDEGFDQGGGGGDEEDLELGGDEQQQSRTRQTEQQRADAAREARLPANVKKALAAVKESDPKAADVLRRAVFASQAWAAVMPGGIRQAREMASAFEEVGGADGIQTLRDEAQTLQSELDAVDDGWKNGGAEFLSKLAEEDPEAFSRNMPLALTQFQKSDKDGYNAALGRIFYNTMTGNGVINTLSQIWALAQSNKTQPGMAGVLEGLQSISESFNGIRDLASQQPERKPDRERERLKARETEFERKQADAFKGEVGREIKSHLEGGILREVGKLLKLRNVSLAHLRQKDPDRFETLVADADRRLAAAITKDKPFQQQKDRLMQTGDKARVLRLYQQKIDFLLADARGPKIARSVAKIFFSGMPARSGQQQQRQNGQNQGDRGRQQQRQQQGGGGGENNNQVARVAQRPAPGTIDYSRTDDSMILDGEAVLKNGKRVKWR